MKRNFRTYVSPLLEFRPRSVLKLALSIWMVLIGLHLQSQEVIDLWTDMETPYFKDNDLQEYEEELWGTKCLLDVTAPTLTIYPAQGINSGKAVLIIPGGGYGMVAIHHEGHDVAKALSERGITAAVLKYRIPNPESSDSTHLVPLTDARRALTLLRDRRRFLEFNNDQVGVMGFSAGSHLATVLGLWKSEKQNENPNFSALIYGVTDLSDKNLAWLERALYHRKMTAQEKKQNTLLDQVDDATPPAFLVHAYDDDVCSVEESTGYAKKLRENRISVETHLFSTGGHGFGMGRAEDGTNQWVPLFINWVKRL